MPSLVEIGLVVLEKMIFQICTVFSQFRNYHPLEKNWPLIWTNLNPLHPRSLCAKFGWNWPSGSGEDDFFNFVYVFSLFRNYPLLGKNWPFIWTNLNSLQPMMHCAKFGWNRSSGSGEENFLILSMYFRYFEIISPLERAVSVIWTNYNPLYPRMLCAKFGWN